MRSLPPKPLRYKRHRTIWMILQWVYLPLTTIVYSALRGDLLPDPPDVRPKYLGLYSYRKSHQERTRAAVSELNNY
jgi:hypothetical protein